MLLQRMRTKNKECLGGIESNPNLTNLRAGFALLCKLSKIGVLWRHPLAALLQPFSGTTSNATVVVPAVAASRDE